MFSENFVGIIITITTFLGFPLILAALIKPKSTKAALSIIITNAVVCILLEVFIFDMQPALPAVIWSTLSFLLIYNQTRRKKRFYTVQKQKSEKPEYYFKTEYEIAFDKLDYLQNIVGNSSFQKIYEKVLAFFNTDGFKSSIQNQSKNEIETIVINFVMNLVNKELSAAPDENTKTDLIVVKQFLDKELLLQPIKNNPNQDNFSPVHMQQKANEGQASDETKAETNSSINILEEKFVHWELLIPFAKKEKEKDFLFKYKELYTDVKTNKADIDELDQFIHSSSYFYCDLVNRYLKVKEEEKKNAISPKSWRRLNRFYAGLLSFAIIAMGNFVIVLFKESGIKFGGLPTMIIWAILFGLCSLIFRLICNREYKGTINQPAPQPANNISPQGHFIPPHIQQKNAQEQVAVKEEKSSDEIAIDKLNYSQNIIGNPSFQKIYEKVLAFFNTDGFKSSIQNQSKNEIETIVINFVMNLVNKELSAAPDENTKTDLIVVKQFLDKELLSQSTKSYSHQEHFIPPHIQQKIVQEKATIKKEKSSDEIALDALNYLKTQISNPQFDTIAENVLTFFNTVGFKKSISQQPKNKIDLIVFKFVLSLINEKLTNQIDDTARIELYFSKQILDEELLILELESKQ